MRNRKLEIVTRLLPQLPPDHQETLDQAMVTWWANIRDNGGLRLTHHGYEILDRVLGMESWSLDLTDPDPLGTWRSRITKKIILDLDRKLEWPYYLDFNPRKKTRRIVFFSSKEAIMATLYGDLESFLKQYS